MELLYQSVLPASTVHRLAWSQHNLIAACVSVSNNDSLGDGLGRYPTHQLLVFDADRPWEYHCVYQDTRVTQEVHWSRDCRALLSVEQDGVARVWRMKECCINSWERTHKIELSTQHKLLYSNWIEYHSLPTVHPSKKQWPDTLEYLPHSSLLEMVAPHSAVFIYSNGKVQLTSCHHGGECVSSEVLLEEDMLGLVAAEALALANGNILCVVGCSAGGIKLFILSIESSSDSSGFTVTSSPATSVLPTVGQGGRLTDLIMVPDADGCVLHICYDGSNLIKLSLRDDSNSGQYQMNREGLHVMDSPVTSVSCSYLHYHEKQHSSSQLMLGCEEDEASQHWPIEIMVMIHNDHSITVLNRDTYQVLYSGSLNDTILSDTYQPAAKRMRSVDQDSSAGSLALSPNSSCVAISTANGVLLYALCPIILGQTNFTSPPDPSRWSLLLALSAASGRSVWDIAVMASRVAYQRRDNELVDGILSHYMEDFTDNVADWRRPLLPAFFNTCSILHCCTDDGMLQSLYQRDLARLHTTLSLFHLCLPHHNNDDSDPAPSLVDTLSDTLTTHSTEELLDTIASSLTAQDYTIKQDMSSQLQAHACWVIGFAIRLVSRIMATRSKPRPHERDTVSILREALLLLYLWNKNHAHQLTSVTDGALSLLFKVITRWDQSLLSVEDEALTAEVTANIPPEKRPTLLTLTKACYLQGFLHGLHTTQLPEVYQRNLPPRIRPHVHKNYESSDPYSPLGLVVPRGVVPPWSDVFVEGQVDVVHGGSMMKSVLQNTTLKQCSRCRSWTAGSEAPPTARPTPSSDRLLTTDPVQQWRLSWAQQCLCGSPWMLRHSH